MTSACIIYKIKKGNPFFFITQLFYYSKYTTFYIRCQEKGLAK